MYSRLSKPLITACTAVVISFFVVGTAGATAFILTHNGSTSSSPTPGSGDVNVELNCEATASFTEECTKIFRENATHTIQWNETQGILIEDVVNDTGVPWTDFHFEIAGLMPNYSISVSWIAERDGVDIISDSVAEFPDGAISQWIFFSVPFTPTLDGPDRLHIVFEWEAEAGLAVITQHPSIPEPATLALFGLGLAGLGFARRKKAA